MRAETGGLNPGGQVLDVAAASAPEARLIVLERGAGPAIGVEAHAVDQAVRRLVAAAGVDGDIDRGAVRRDGGLVQVVETAVCPGRASGGVSRRRGRGS
jgi:hypothetical protein